MQAAHDAAEAWRVREAKLRDELAASHQTIKRLEAEKVAIEAANEVLRVTANAANAAKDAAEAAASAASGSSISSSSGMLMAGP